MDPHYTETREREFETTIKVLKAYPEEKKDLKPADISKSARELAWVFVTEELLLQKILQGAQPDWGAQPPETMAEIITEYERVFRETTTFLKQMTDEQCHSTVKFFVAPKTEGDIPTMQFIWMMLHDCIHHRGQFSVYLRLAGAKVPSIYGPSADEPWN